ncbi:hypothetical protein HGG79_04015 [Clostridium tetanomorphum]|uniref:Uncharacterized protein n=1 Tax=Clostridium tetanomorphum TaxID=1553 RepID=A0A923E5P2_CLOTT|nr:hypothetical protein [Clostridium tetanomorphum]
MKNNTDAATTIFLREKRIATNVIDNGKIAN